jgi:hypothetical protein
MFNIIKKQAQIVFVTVLILILLAGAIFAYFRFSQNNTSSENKLVVNIDKTVILKQIKQIQVLNTVEQTLQRDFDVTLESNDLALFGLRLLESNRSQKFAITGSVAAGIDLSQINLEDIVFDKEKSVIRITTPAPAITSINILEDKIYLINDRSSFLFNIQNINPETARNRNEKLQKELLKSGNKALLDAACSNKILTTANDNAKQSLKNLFMLVQNDFEIEIITTEAKECGLLPTV